MSSRDTSTPTTGRDRRFVGLMAGTSLDGIDAACCRVGRTDDSPFGYTIDVEAFLTVPYPDPLRDRLLSLCDEATGRVDEVCRLNRELGVRFAAAATAVADEAGVDLESITAIGTHGQTVWHIPNPVAEGASTAEPLRSTLQIGDGATIAYETGAVCVSDFRTADVAAGGEGAPLTPFLDATAFGGENVRVLQNVGGIGNCTILPPEADREEIVAFDTGPGNMVIDALVERLSDGERTYDDSGRWAAAGEPDEELVADALHDPYFERSPPKTTGRERFGRRYAEGFLRDGRAKGLSAADLLATATMLTARSIADAYERFADPYPEAAFVSGGGAHNETLLSYLRAELDCPVSTTRELGMDPDSKEAALFALLAATRLDRTPNTIPNATGASEPVVMGKVSRP